MVTKIRAHHGMCLAFFKGNGYSAEFTEHMWRIKHSLDKKNPKIRIVNAADDICAHCPGNEAGICKNEHKAARYDNAVLSLCQLETGSELNWETFAKLVQAQILRAGKRKEICGDCQWDSLCHKDDSAV